jgi:hypothetical protein
MNPKDAFLPSSILCPGMAMSIDILMMVRQDLGIVSLMTF